MARREKLFLGSSLLYSFGDSLLISNVSVCNMLLKNACKNHQHASGKLQKWSQKWSQNVSKIDPEGALEATWEPSLKQGASKTSLLMILAPFWDPLWDHFGFILGIIFLTFFWGGFLTALASILAPKTPTKWDQQGGQEQHLKIIDFACIYYTLATSRGPENHHFWSFFGTLFRYLFKTSFSSIFDHFGDPFGTLWAPQKHSKKDTKKRDQKRAKR